MSGRILGVIPVAHTPFTDTDEIDWESLERQVDWALTCGAHGFCTGMVSELLRLTAEERLALTSRLAKMHGGRGLFIMSVGAESTKQAVLFAKHADFAGCDGLMAVPPLSTRLSAVDVFQYFCAIAEATPLPLIVQDASGYVGQSIPEVVYRDLLERFGPERILFKPESAPVGPVITRLRELSHGAARVFDGSGGNLLVDAYRRGVVGTIPGMEFLEAVIALWQALEAGDDARAYRIYFPLCALVTLQLQAGLDGFLAIEKHIMHQRGLFQRPHRRKPYSWHLDEETRVELERLLVHLRAAVG